MIACDLLAIAVSIRLLSVVVSPLWALDAAVVAELLGGRLGDLALGQPVGVGGIGDDDRIAEPSAQAAPVRSGYGGDGGAAAGACRGFSMWCLLPGVGVSPLARCLRGWRLWRAAVSNRGFLRQLPYRMRVEQHCERCMTAAG